MVFGPVIGAGLGVLTGAGVGYAIFSGDRPKDYGFLLEAADRDDNIRTPAAANVTEEMRALIPLTPEWTYWPDYDRWMMINRLLRLMWPKLTTAIFKEVIGLVKPIVQEQLNKLPAVLGVVEDITLGPYSLMDAEHLDPHIADKYFTLGDHPVRVAGMKVYSTSDDSTILEVPVMWGSNAVFDINVYLRVGPVRLVVPISVSHIQFKATSRIVLSMVDTVPCIGGATLSLLGVPHVDFRLVLFGGPDLMALPGVKAATHMIIQYVVKQLLLYPNSVSVPLMPNFGVTPEPQGMVRITLSRIEGLKSTDLLTKGDPYVVFTVREGRSQRSKIVKANNNPEFDEEFFLLVDDFKEQRLKIEVYDFDKLCPTDDLLGTAEVLFSEEVIETHPITGAQEVVYHLADWIKTPMLHKKLALPLAVAGGGMLKLAAKAAANAAKAAGQAANAAKNLVLMQQGEQEDDANMVTIKVAKTRKEVRQAEEKAAAAEAAKAAAVAAAEKARTDAAMRATAAAAAASARATGSGAEAAAAEQLAHTVEWTEDDEKALWAEWKAITDVQKAAAAAEAKRRKALSKEAREAEDAAAAAVKAEAAAADAELVLVEERVRLRGNEKKPALNAKSVGTMYLTLSFMPFDKPMFDDDVELKPVKSGLSALVPFDPPPAREILSSVNDFQTGVLTVTIFKASRLASPGLLLAPDPYVEMVLVDCDQKRPSEVQRTSVKRNDGSPRWLETFDFVMVSAGSMLTLNVCNKVTLLDAVASIKLNKSRFQDSVLGKIQVPVADVARNGSLKDTWALQDAESGTLEMKLQWQNCNVEQYVD